jgi:oligogalacturonide lyase
MRSLLTALAAFGLMATCAHATVGQRFPSEKQVILDRVTGRPLTALTDGHFHDAKIYQTDPQWAFDQRHIIFRSSNRSPDGHGQIFSVDEISGDIVQVTDGPGVNISAINVARKSNRVYYVRADDDHRLHLIFTDLTRLLDDAMSGHPDAKGYETEVAVLPEGFILAGGFTLDASETTAYFGFDQQEAPPRPQGQAVPQVPGGLLALDLKTGASHVVIKTPFRVGHIQANPFKDGEILFCNETGGDAPQRMWLADAAAGTYRPVYPEGPDDWVTHEQFADADHVIFNLMGHTDKLRQRPSGIMVVSLRDGEVEPLGQVPAHSALDGDRNGPNSFWHNGVTYDGRYAAGDDFNGSVWLIDRKTDARTLLTTGHVMRPDHAHPSFSPDGSRILIQSGLLTDGRSLALMVVPVTPND